MASFGVLGRRSPTTFWVWPQVSPRGLVEVEDEEGFQQSGLIYCGGNFPTIALTS